MGSADESFFRYALNVLQACSVAVFSVLFVPRKFPDDFFRAVKLIAGNDGRRVIRAFGLGGGLLGRLVSDGRRLDGVA